MIILSKACVSIYIKKICIFNKVKFQLNMNYFVNLGPTILKIFILSKTEAKLSLRKYLFLFFIYRLMYSSL